jgi:outer membrane protein OmpA-like peptidoglycan-associated protein
VCLSVNLKIVEMKTNSMLKGKFLRVFTLLLVVSVLVSCKSWNNTGKGAAIGVGAGALLGAGIGKLAGNTAAGAAVGAAVGGATGAVIGKYMDKQAAEMEAEMEAAKIERVGESIKVTFDSGLLFKINSAELSPKSKEELKKFSEVLNKYPDTNLFINGHTDDTGSDELNQNLSEKRAASVANYLNSLKVEPTRLTIAGFGEAQPIVPNTSAENRALNRRVEVIVNANADLIKAAQSGELQVK